MTKNFRLSRRALVRAMAASTVLAATASLVGPIRRVAAQDANVDASFSDQKLPGLGLPTLDLTQTAEGVQGVPASIPAGQYLVNYTAQDVVGYLLFAQVPAGLSEEEALKQAKDAGSNDIQGEGWVYGGGTYADAGLTVQVVVDLPAGDWSVVNSHMPPGGDFTTEEIYQIVPMTVTGDTATAVATASPVASFAADVDVTIPGMAFELSADPVPAGPQLWRFTNASDQAHHVVITRTPKVVEAADIDQMVGAFMSATPPAGDEWFTQQVWVGYTALFSPGFHVVNEFDFEPGNYLLACYIADKETGMPHLMMGMWKAFTVA